MYLIFFIWNVYFLKKTNSSSNNYLLRMNAPLNAPEKTNSLGEWRVSPEHRVGSNRAGVWGLRYRARGRIWRVSPGRVPPSKATFSGCLLSCNSLLAISDKILINFGSNINYNNDRCIFIYIFIYLYATFYQWYLWVKSRYHIYLDFIGPHWDISLVIVSLYDFQANFVSIWHLFVK